MNLDCNWYCDSAERLPKSILFTRDCHSHVQTVASSISHQLRTSMNTDSRQMHVVVFDCLNEEKYKQCVGCSTLNTPQPVIPVGIELIECKSTTTPKTNVCHGNILCTVWKIKKSVSHFLAWLFSMNIQLKLLNRIASVNGWEVRQGIEIAV